MLFPLGKLLDAITARAGLRALHRLEPHELDYGQLGYLGIDDVFDEDGILIRLESQDRG